MKRKIFTFLFFCTVIILFAGCSITLNKNERAQKEMLKSRYGINEVSTLDFCDAHTVRMGVGVWFEHKEIEVPAFGRFRCGEKVVCVRGDKDDFYYDELVEGVNSYYRRLFDAEKLFVVPCATQSGYCYSSTSYSSFFKYEDIGEFDDSTLQYFLNHYATEVTIIMQKNENESDETAVRRISEIIDSYPGGTVIEVQLMKNLFEIEEYRQPSESYEFDSYVIDNVDFSNRITRLSPKN